MRKSLVMRQRARPNDALDAMYQHDMELGIDPLEPSPVIVVGQPPAEVPTFRIDPPPWSENYEPSLDVGPDFVEAELDVIGPTSEAVAAVKRPSDSPSLGSSPTERDADEPNPRGRKRRKALRRSVRQAWAR